MAILRAAFARRAEFGGRLKMGRTQLQDAVPMTLGQEFRDLRPMLARDLSRLAEAPALITEDQLWAPPPSAPASTPIRPTSLPSPHIWRSSAASRWSRHPT